MKKRIFGLVLTCVLFSGFAFAQETDDFEMEDDFFLDLNEDLTDAINEDEALEESGSGGSRSKIKQGLWIETVNHNNAIIRDLATGEKSGYELDSSHLKSYANWWFWGDVTPNFHLDAEIAAWSFDKTLYQANSFGANVPVVTWGDGLQTLATLPFSWFYNANDNGIGAFNKMGFSVITPYVNVKLGYGNLQANGMSEFTGIYTVLDRWLNVDKGFTEITNGKKLQKFGKTKLELLAALSMMKGTYGTYDIVKVDYDDVLKTALTFGSTTTEDELFFYNRTNTNAVSAYLSYAPLDNTSFELHGIDTFGTGIENASDAFAFAGRVNLDFGKVSADLTGSYAGKEVDSVWGADNSEHDDICADKIYADVNGKILATDWLSFELDDDFEMENSRNVSKGNWTYRNQVNADVDLSMLTKFGISVGAYGVMEITFPYDEAADARGKAEATFSEAGVEVIAEEIPGFKKIIFDYGCKREDDIFYNSIMFNADVNDRLNVHAGSLIRINKNKDDKTFVPFGISAGFTLKKLSLPGNPQVYVHGTYGMNPYSENQYSLYRADNSLNIPGHRTYLLNDLYEDFTTSQISFGMIWALE